MARGLITSVLSAALVAAAVLSGPCLGGACARAREMDCCRTKAGIASPNCCPAPQQLRGVNAPPATAERPLVRALLVPACSILPRTALATPRAMRSVRTSAAGPAPPGGPLLAQSTSLLL